MYDFGISNVWGFDEQLAREYGCEVMCFDPSMNMKSHRHSAKVWFYNVGLSNFTGRRGNWKMKTYDSLLQSNGHVDKTIDILKIDIEYSEWDALEHMLKNNSRRHVKQLLFESQTKEMSRNQVTGKKTI